MVSRVGCLVLGIGIGIGLMAVLTLIADGYRVSEQGVTTLAEDLIGWGGLLLGCLLVVGGPFIGHKPNNSRVG